MTFDAFDEPACEGCGRDRGHEPWCDFHGLDEPAKILIETVSNAELIDAIQAAEDARDAARAELEEVIEERNTFASEVERLRLFVQDFHAYMENDSEDDDASFEVLMELGERAQKITKETP
jgi:hypothetical protein